MKVSFNWLRELVDLNSSNEELVTLLPLRTIGTKEVTQDFVELDMKGYNRADLLSLRGVAYEVAAITGSKIKYQETNPQEYVWNPVKPIVPEGEVKVEDEDLCPLYVLAKIEGLSVSNSSEEWKKKLEDSGLRTVNNLTDVTNLVMLEYGQPLHAFDAAEVEGQSIVVRTAKRGEKLTTLDGKERILEEEDVVIADPKKVLGLAGVMGGKNSEITDQTTSVLLEAAIFDPTSLRRTSQRLGIYSEAAKRFQHGLTKGRLFAAIDAAIRMYQEMGGKLTKFTVVGRVGESVKTISLSIEKTNSLIGIELQAQQIEEYLHRLGFILKQVDQGWEVEVPEWRLDINIEEDLIEEVARLYGYEKIPAKGLEGELPEKVNQTLFKMISTLREELVNLGLTEIQTYSFYSTKVLQALGFNEENLTALVRVANPISKETEYLRQNIWPNLVEVVDKNFRQGFEDIAVFEIGKVYTPQEDGLPKEEYRLSIALMNGSDNPTQELIAVLKEITLEGLEISQSTPTQSLQLFHPKRFASLKINKTPSGGVAEVHLRVLDSFGISQRVAVLEIGLTAPQLPQLKK